MRHRTGPRSRRATLGALTVAGVLALAACGDDDSEASGDDNGDDTEDIDTSDLERDEYGVGLINTGGDDDESSDEGSDDTAEDGDGTSAEGGDDTAGEAGDDAGADGERITLPPAYEVGQSSTTTAEMSIGLDIDMASVSQNVEMVMEMGMTEEVVEVSENGEATVEMSIDSIEVIEAPDEMPTGALDSQFDQVLNEVIVVTYSQTGVQMGEAEMQDGSPLPAELAESFGNAVGVEAFPSEPVGEGARWSSIDEIEAAEGLSVEGETFYELVELTDDGYVIEVSQDFPIDESVDGVDMSGTFSGTGEIRGDTSNPLQLDMSYDQDGDLDVSGEGESGSMSTSIGVEMTSGE